MSTLLGSLVYSKQLNVYRISAFIHIVSFVCVTVPPQGPFDWSLLQCILCQCTFLFYFLITSSYKAIGGDR